MGVPNLGIHISVEFDSNFNCYQLMLVFLVWVLFLFKLGFYVKVGLWLLAKQIFWVIKFVLDKNLKYERDLKWVSIKIIWEPAYRGLGEVLK